MERYLIEQTVDSPLIDFNPNTGKFEISGKSFPEDTIDVYLPVMDWLDEYIQNPLPKTNVAFKLDYFNSSSYKALLNIMVKLEQIRDGQHEVNIDWYYHEKDRDMREAGEEFAELVEIPFSFLSR